MRQRQRRPDGVDEAADDRAGAADGDLLADDRADGGLERVDAARHAQSGPACDEVGEDRIAAEGGVDRHRVGVEIEQPADAAHGRRQVAPVGQLQRHAHVHPVALDDGQSVDDGDAVPARQRQRPVVAGAVEVLDAADRPGREERHRRAQVEWLAHGEIDRDRARRSRGRPTVAFEQPAVASATPRTRPAPCR